MFRKNVVQIFTFVFPKLSSRNKKINLCSNDLQEKNSFLLSHSLLKELLSLGTFIS